MPPKKRFFERLRPYLCMSVSDSVRLHISLSVCTSPCLSVYLRVSQPVCLSICLSVRHCLSFVVRYLCLCLSVGVSVHYSVFLSVCPLVGLSVGGSTADFPSVTDLLQSPIIEITLPVFLLFQSLEDLFSKSFFFHLFALFFFCFFFFCHQRIYPI